MSLGDRFECRFQIGKRFNAVDLRRFDQRGNPAPGLGALVVAGEECVLSVEGNRAHEVLDCIGVDLDPAIGQEGLQSIPMAVDVTELFAQALVSHSRKSATRCAVRA